MRIVHLIGYGADERSLRKGLLVLNKLFRYRQRHCHGDCASGLRSSFLRTWRPELLGWVGGYGFTGTMGFFLCHAYTGDIRILAIVANSFGRAWTGFGFMTRVAAVGVLSNMIVAGAMFTANSLFMNWTGAQKGEGYGYICWRWRSTVLLIIRGAEQYPLTGYSRRLPEVGPTANCLTGKDEDYV